MDYDSDQKAAPSVSKLSKTPSWVMLGFVLGAATVYAFFSGKKEAAPTSSHLVKAPAPAPARLEAAQPLTTLTTIEAVFDMYGRFAVWDDNLTEVAMWDSSTHLFSDYYEVRRDGDKLWFRSISKLTRRPLNHGKLPPPNTPLQFTETEEAYREWRDTGRFERPPESFVLPANAYPPSVARPATPALPVPSAPRPESVADGAGKPNG